MLIKKNVYNLSRKDRKSDIIYLLYGIKWVYCTGEKNGLRLISLVHFATVYVPAQAKLFSNRKYHVAVIVPIMRLDL